MVQMVKNETINKVIYSQNDSTAYGIRTRATAVKGRRPRPLDERGLNKSKFLRTCASTRGDRRIRTAVGGFADLCLATRPCRLKVVVRPSGLEPETYCLEGSCSIQLSYGRSTN